VIAAYRSHEGTQADFGFGCVFKIIKQGWRHDDNIFLVVTDTDEAERLMSGLR
jgi:hypothetical protein